VEVFAGTELWFNIQNCPCNPSYHKIQQLLITIHRRKVYLGNASQADEIIHKAPTVSILFYCKD
jgi:hypothetical protein